MHKHLQALALFILCTTVNANAQDCITLDAEAIRTAPVSGYAPTYFDKGRAAIAVNSVKHEDKPAAVSFAFEGASGRYDIQLTTLLESDGESTYQVLVDGKLVGVMQNPETTTDYLPHENIFKNIRLKSGATITVVCIAHTNGKVPEGNGTAYARGRWSSISFCKR